MNTNSDIQYPPLGQILEIGQGEFGFLHPSVSKDYIATDSLGPCIGLYLSEKNKQFQSLAHLEFSWNYSYYVNLMIEYLINNDLTTGQFGKIHILRSKIADEDGIDKIVRGFKDSGYDCQILNIYRSTIDVIYDRQGNMSLIDPLSLQNSKRVDTIPPRYGIRCVNESIILN